MKIGDKYRIVELSSEVLTLTRIVEVVEPAPAKTRAAVVLEVAHREWLSVVDESTNQGKGQVDRYIHVGLGWSEPPFDGDFQWCGAFAAYCYGEAGLKMALRKGVSGKRLGFASTYRLWNWVEKGTGSRYVKPGDLRPGDVGIVGARDGHQYGSHVVIVRENLWPKEILTYEGNARARQPASTPNGKLYEGVITRARPHASFAATDSDLAVLWGVRPLDSDWETAT